MCMQMLQMQNGSVKPNAQLGAAAQPELAARDSNLDGVPPLPACRVRLLWEEDTGRAAQVAFQSTDSIRLKDIICSLFCTPGRHRGAADTWTC
jgi:hypothetical protein